MVTREQDQSTTNRPEFHRGVFFTGTGTALNVAFLFLETMIAARLLSPDDYGVYILLIAIVNFFVMAIDFGQRIATTQLIASSDTIKQAALANSAWIFRVIVLAIISIIIWLVQPLLLLLDPTRALSRYIVYVPLMVIPASFDELFLGMLQGFQAYRRMAVAQILRSVLRLGLTILFLSVLELGVKALIYSWTISFVVSAVYQYLILPMSRRFVFQRPLLVEMLRFGFPLQLSRLLWFAFTQVHVLLLGALAGPASAAYYSVAARIPRALQQLSESYIAVYFPTTAALLARGERSRAFQVLNHSLRLISFGAALVALTAVVFSREIVTLLFSEQYAVISKAFALLMIGFHVTFVLSILGYTLTAAGYPGRSLGENLFRTILTILEDLLLIPVFGFMGPAFASLAAAYMSNPVAIWLLRRSGIPVVLAPYVKQTAFLLLGAALYWWILPAGLVYKIATVIAFVVINVALSTISRDDLSLVFPEMVTKRLAALIGAVVKV